MKRRIDGRGAVFVVIGVLSFLLFSAVGGAMAPQYGGVLHVADRLMPPSLDPHHFNGIDGLASLLPFNTLINYNQQLEFVPELAASWEIVDNTTYVFYLRDNVEFHDGTPFDAEAVKWNFTRMASEYSQVASFFSMIESVDVIDTYTVQFKLSAPYAPFLDNLVASGQMVSPTAVEAMGNDAFQKNPVGTGPFKIVSYDAQRREIEFVRNENYFLEGLPYLDGIVLTEISDPQTRLLAFKSGQFDFLLGVPPNNVEELIDGGYNLASVLGSSNTIDFITFNTQIKPFSDLKVRQAIAHAIDQELLLEFLDHTLPLMGPLPESSWGSNSSKEPFAYDPAKARALLAESGYPQGFSTTLKIWNNDPQREDLAVVVQEMLGQVGIDVTIEVLEAGTLVQQMMQGEFEVASLHWGGGGSLDPNGNLYVLFHSESPNSFIARYHNEEVNALLDQALLITDRGERQALYQKADQLIYDDLPMIWFGRFTSYVAYSDRVHGIEPLRPAGYYPDKLGEIWIQQ